MNHFDLKAREWDNDPNKLERAKMFAKRIQEIMGNKKINNALEFGCGTGSLSFQLKDSFQEITLIDNSSEMIKVLNEKIKDHKVEKFTPVYADIMKEPVNIPEQDIIYTLMTLHHIPDLNKILEIFNSLLKPEGYLCIGDLVSEDGSFHAGHTHFEGHNGFDKDSLSQLLKLNGFEVVQYEIVHEIVKEDAGSVRRYPLFLLTGRKLSS